MGTFASPSRREFIHAGLGVAAGAFGLLGNVAAGASSRPQPAVAAGTRRSPAEHEAWLAQVTEDPLEPDVAICDAHHHFFGGDNFSYLPEDLFADVQGNNVVSTVFVDCGFGYRPEGRTEMRPIGETERVDEIATNCARDPRCRTAVAAAIVSHADLTLGEAVTPVLEAHLAASPQRFRGIRHSCAWHPSPAFGPVLWHLDRSGRHTAGAGGGGRPGLMQEPSFRKGLACVAKLSLTFDSWTFMTQLEELTGLARAIPELTIVCDHLGGLIGPQADVGPKTEAFARWRNRIRELATCPNVVMKLGGAAVPRAGFGWHERSRPPGSQELADATAPYYHECLEAFGVRRCMFVSNFPMDKIACSYRVLWNSFKRVCQGFSAAEKSQLLHDTAARVYRIGPARRP